MAGNEGIWGDPRGPLLRLVVYTSSHYGHSGTRYAQAQFRFDHKCKSTSAGHITQARLKHIFPWVQKFSVRRLGWSSLLLHLAKNDDGTIFIHSSVEITFGSCWTNMWPTFQKELSIYPAIVWHPDGNIFWAPVQPLMSQSPCLEHHPCAAVCSLCINWH